MYSVYSWLPDKSIGLQRQSYLDVEKERLFSTIGWYDMMKSQIRMQERQLLNNPNVLHATKLILNTY